MGVVSLLSSEGRFLGIPGHSGILLSVDDQYLTGTYEEFGIKSGSSAAPDVAAHLERTVSDPNAKKPLSAESYRRFRRCLGKLLWLSQSRHDLKLWLSLVGTQQAAPCQGTEAAIRVYPTLLGAGYQCVLEFAFE